MPFLMHLASFVLMVSRYPRGRIRVSVYDWCRPHRASRWNAIVQVDSVGGDHHIGKGTRSRLKRD